MLIDSGYKEDDRSDPSPLRDLSTKAEQTLGRLVREKYHTDYYILGRWDSLDYTTTYSEPISTDNFRANARPFYTMPIRRTPNYPTPTISSSEARRSFPAVEKKMREAKIVPETMTDYLDGFKWGCPPHGGGGVGHERVAMLMLKLGGVRWGSLIPRDPRNFPQKDQPLAQTTMVVAQNLLLHGPESTTFTTKNKRIDDELPPLENVRCYSHEPDLQLTDPPNLTADCQVWQCYEH